MMFLTNAIRAEVEPVPRKKGWYQLTGKHIVRSSAEISETFGELSRAGISVDHTAKVLGIHDYDPEISFLDPRFIEEDTRRSQV